MRLFEGYPKLSDDTVLLHKMSLDDAEALHALATNPKVYKYLPTFLFEQKYDAEEVIKRLDDECLKTKDSVVLGVYLKSDPKRLIGLAEIYSYKEERNKVSIGTRLDEPYWGKGFATRITDLLISYIFNETEIRTITAHVIKGNETFPKVLRKFGFVDKYKEVSEDWGFDQPVIADKYLLKRDWYNHPLMKDNILAGYLEQGYTLIRKWRGNDYIMGTGCLNRVAEHASRFGKKALVVANTAHMSKSVETVLKSLEDAGIEIAGGSVCPGARPNAPREDVYRIATYILQHKPDCIVAVGGGSTIDTCKAASVLASLGGCASCEIDSYFGTGKVSEALKATGSKLTPVVAVQTSASSGAHLTKYSNITDPVAGQKKLIVDPSIVPACALFDYDVTCSMPARVTIDGALDALSHTFEVFCGAKEESYETAREICECAFNLVLTCAKTAVEKPDDKLAREAIGLATDLGGYAIMVGGTSGGHLTSFSLVDVAGHGTACGIMNPYYAVFYGKAIQKQLKVLAGLFASHGFLKEDVESLKGRALAETVANAMMDFSKSIGAPTKLSDLDGFSEDVHVKRAVDAAKDPDLKMKLQNMPVSMTSEDVEPYMKPILLAATRGDLSLIVEM